MSNEQNVAVNEVPDGGGAINTLYGTDAESLLGQDKGAVPLEFEEGQWPLFSAKWAKLPNKDGQHWDIVIQFFLPNNVAGTNAEQQWLPWWTSAFSKHLDASARGYFDATAPRLQAKYTPEVRSWWFKAQGFGHLLEWQKFVRGFLDELSRKAQGQV